MPYYKNVRDLAPMPRGRGFMRGSMSSSRGSWNGGRGSSSWSSRGSWHSPRGGFSSRGGGHHSSSSSHHHHHGSGRLDSSFSSSFDSRSKYGGSSSSKRYSSSKSHDEPRKSYKPESSYSGRESGHRSPDRKRPRTEAPSSRHDSSYGGSGGGGGGGYGSSSRYESSYTERRSFSSDRHPTPSFSRRDEFRRPSGPPRGGYRGRISSRGHSSRGIRLRERLPPGSSSRRRLTDSSYAVRKRILSTRSIDHVRRLKISKLRSAIAARKKDSGSKSEDEKRDDKKDEHKEDTKKSDEEKKNEDDLDSDGDNKKHADRSNTPIKQEKDDDSKDEGSRKSEKDEKHDKLLLDDGSTTKRKSFIKLNCPHCGIKAVTFHKYELHLQSRTHIIAMRKLAMKQKSILSQMRLAQRNAQNELEKSSDDLTPRTNFCPLCKLNYKQRKLVHQTSEAHKNMKKFLMPYCKVCSISFKSPMTYESHCCSIDHIKRKQRLENGEHSDEFDDNLDNFTTIDSVGDGDATDDEDSKDTKEPVSVGIEQIRKIEAYYCDLCKMYIGRSNDDSIQSVLIKHCKQRTHLQRYIRYKEDKDIEKRAEKLQRKETAEKEDKKQRQDKEHDGDEIDRKPTVKSDDKDNDGKNLDDEEARDDKIWADVDKDLDDLLAKEEGNKSSDEDEDVNGERYDRFKYSEKNGDEKKDNQIDTTNSDDAKVNNTTEDN